VDKTGPSNVLMPTSLAASGVVETALIGGLAAFGLPRTRRASAVAENDVVADRQPEDVGGLGDHDPIPSAAAPGLVGLKVILCIQRVGG
jgi:hypothetical protein